MTPNYRKRTENIRERINPEHFSFNKSFSDELSTISYSEVLVYIRTAMKGVEEEYTRKSKDAGERVKEHLLKELQQVTFKYQGSVMTDTHIRGVSDIDLLVITEKFYQAARDEIKGLLDNPERKQKFFQTSIDKLHIEAYASIYQGNSSNDLRKNRMDSEKVLTETYSICDINKPKSIKIKNLNLNREVDVVIANWYDDITSIVNNKGEYRGIQVYNKDLDLRGKADFPFLSIKRINERSADTGGRLKKMIRFLKNIKADSNQDIDLSSFDINAICYDIEVLKYKELPFYSLVRVIYEQLKSISVNKAHSDNVISVDSREYIFRGRESKLQNLKALLSELEPIFIDLQSAIRV